MIGIVMDSGGDLPPELIEQYGITTVPINIHFGTQVYQEGVDISPSEFYRRVDEDKVMPKTAQPSPHQFMEKYREVVRRLKVTDIISVNITSQLSGTHASSLIAAAEMADEVRVHAFDSRAGSTFRTAEIEGKALPDSDSLVLGLGGSASRMVRRISMIPTCRSCSFVMGVVPVSSS